LAVAALLAVPARAGAVSAPLVWHACTGSIADRCTTVHVPLDYARPGGGSVPLAVIERPAADGHPQGTLFLNPGGPGESGVQILPVLAAFLPPEVTARFTLVSFDERGTGASDPLRCGPPPAGFAALDPTPSGNGALPGRALFAALARDCARRYPRLLPTVNTVTSARDMDQIRRALGPDRISYYGLSYGTVLGTEYADRYGEHLQGMVLDGAVDAALPLARQAAEEAPALEASLRHYLHTCAAHPACPLGSDPVAGFSQLAAALTAHPLPAPGGGDDVPVGVGDLLTATLYYLTVPGFATAYPQALQAAQAGDGAPLRTLSLSFEVDLDGASLVPAEWAIACGDTTHHASAAALGALARRLRQTDPLAGDETPLYVAGGCDAWPPATQPVAPPGRGRPVPTLVLGNTGDPNTPHLAAVQLARALPGSSLLTWVGWGHTWLLNGNPDPCMRAAVTAFLASGRRPAQARCS
jgi:pimeloyl-ACP methyl ester carboxylesterase